MATYTEGFEAGLAKAVEIISRRFNEFTDQRYLGEEFYADEIVQLCDDIVSDIETEPLPEE